MKRAFKIKLKAFFIIFKGLSLKKTKQIFLEGESPTLKKVCHISIATTLLTFIWVDYLSSHNIDLYSGSFNLPEISVFKIMLKFPLQSWLQNLLIDVGFNPVNLTNFLIFILIMTFSLMQQCLYDHIFVWS